jgi:DNA mismatch repair ATPase MutL
MAMQQHAQAQAQAQAGNNNQGQPGQMGPQQLQNLQQAQIAAAQQHHQAQAAQAAQAAAAQQNQPQSQHQPQPQQSQPNSQAQTQQPQPQAQQHPSNMQQQQAAATAAMLQNQQRVGDKFKGQCLMKLMQFGDHLSNFGVISKPLEAYMATGAQRLAAQGIKQRDDLNYWLGFVDRFFSPKGVLRHSVWLAEENTGKQYEITFPALARYFHTHFESGIKNMQMIMEKGSEKELPNNGHYIESQKSSFVYWFDNGSQVSFLDTILTLFDTHLLTTQVNRKRHIASSFR